MELITIMFQFPLIAIQQKNLTNNFDPWMKWFLMNQSKCEGNEYAKDN